MPILFYIAGIVSRICFQRARKTDSVEIIQHLLLVAKIRDVAARKQYYFVEEVENI